jgi:hypothetical protein
VSGKVTNSYSKNDYTLRVGFRKMFGYGKGIGLKEILIDEEMDKKIQNFNMKDLINGHQEYKKKQTQILDIIDPY